MSTEDYDDPEAVPDPTPKEREPAARVTKKKKGPGRPPKQRLAVEVPPEVQKAIAIAPLGLLATAVHRFTGRLLQFSQESIDNTSRAFEVWLSSFNVQLTPGWALLSCYAMALGSGLTAMQLDPEHPKVKEAMRRAADAEAEAKRVAEAKPQEVATDAPRVADDGSAAAAAA